jgi:hypothetical protein
MQPPVEAFRACRYWRRLAGHDSSIEKKSVAGRGDGIEDDDAVFGGESPTGLSSYMALRRKEDIRWLTRCGGVESKSAVALYFCI